MTLRVWLVSVAAIALLTGAWMAGATAASRAPLRSFHSEPARSTPTGMVTVTDEGKLFHDPQCPLIHGPARVESGRQALLDGYAPCLRCQHAE